ncbi:HK97 family phage prohead protease [Sphingomonas melonis]|uniref:Prohead serine protease domain-containing protein n=1 Tax=Sphingomonas melonis TaxID=152682 RepID=A0A7Y9FQU4_9SPHN|nr:HK97 family phage prohead protease [Sphingomonas melonis]NYD91402.1 hypothetical protein [Sphingomonas melonis]
MDDRLIAVTGRAPERKPFVTPLTPRICGPYTILADRRAPERKSAGTIEQLACDLELKFDDGTGRIDGYGSVFGLLDRGGDIVLPGAFKASLRGRKGGVPMLWQHDPSIVIGLWDKFEEDEKGLKISGQLVMDVPQAAVARALVKAGAVKGLSIGYRTQDYEIDRTTGARRLKKVDLWEVSLVTFPMLPEAQITGVKSALDARALEQQLRSECNLSSAAAVKAVAIVKQHLRDGGDKPEQEPRDGVKDLLMSLRRAGTALA